MRFVELFAGIGLVRLALERSGWKCIFANDIDPKKYRTYAKNFEASDFSLGDVWQMDVGALSAPVDLVTASFPCTDLSLAGNRSGLSGKHSSAFWALIRVLEGLHGNQGAPKVVMVENVVGFLTSRGGEDFLSAVGALNEQGYVVDAVVVDARHFTAQSRPRLFLIAVREDLADAHMTRPSPGGIILAWNQEITNAKSPLRPAALRQLMKRNENLKWGLIGLPSLPASNQTLADILEDLPAWSDQWWSEEQTTKLISQMSELHLLKLERMKSRPAYSYGTIYRRKREGGMRAELRTDGLAGCLRTPRGGSSKQIVIRAGNGEVRARWMTPREYGRLQGAPDSFVLPESELEAYFGFGDAVCVPTVEWLAKHAINPVVEKSESRSQDARSIRSRATRAVSRRPPS